MHEAVFNLLLLQVFNYTWSMCNWEPRPVVVAAAAAINRRCGVAGQMGGRYLNDGTVPGQDAEYTRQLLNTDEEWQARCTVALWQN